MSAPQWLDDGSERYVSTRVVFARPFALGSAPEIYPAGVYEVETKFHAVGDCTHTALVRSATTLIIPTNTGTYAREVRGSELDDAIARDAAPDQLQK